MSTNTDIIVDLREESNFAFGELYKNYFKSINHFVLNNNGSTSDAEDIFQDTMLILIQKLRQDDFQLSASIKTYITAIAKHLWLKKLRNSYRETEFTDLHDNKFYEEINLSIEQEKTYWDKLQFYMTKITDHCSRLMHDMFFKK